MPETSKVTCPFCQKDFERFLPEGRRAPVLKKMKVIGGGFKLNVLCPECNCRERERLIYLYLIRQTDIFEAKIKLLHVAPEKLTGKILKNSKNIDYLSIDLENEADLRMDLSQLSLPDNTFDVIICNHVLEHVEDDSKAMKELYRVLKPGGWAILQVPIALELDQTYENPKVKTDWERYFAYGQGDHVRLYAKDYQDRLSEAGFQVTVYDFSKDFGIDNFFKYGLDLQEKIYIGKKNLD